jgi:hypothetical protein
LDSTGGRQSLTLAYLISSTLEAHAKAQKHTNDAKEGKGLRTETYRPKSLLNGGTFPKVQSTTANAGQKN